ncbi:Tubulin binding cofactor C, putative [Angomonas deanei]|uniref:Tubulin binding cofactor C, putative n=1 Tax=Angomonas deanei TaxID=59799 RepID=A0A7G2C295_9TRYP|nr:Tubulin binding cofactor C, putative [Angomonas deanei]
MDQEEKFLKARQEREESRLQAVAEREISETGAQRQQFEEQLTVLEAAVEQQARSGALEEAEEQLGTLRRLVQDTSHSTPLTAFEMSKANRMLARLEQLLLQERRQKNAASTSEGAPGKKFKFSSKAKAKVEEKAPTTTAGLVTAPDSSVAPIGSKVYGQQTGGHLFIAPSRAVFIRDCTNTTIYCAPTAGSAFFTNLTDCTVYVCCHQLRLNRCRGVSLYVWCSSTPIIEYSEGVGFGPYSCWRGLTQSTIDGQQHATSEEWATTVGEQTNMERVRLSYTVVDDFQWLKKTASPHWRVMEESEWAYSEEVFGEPAVPVVV